MVYTLLSFSFALMAKRKATSRWLATNITSEWDIDFDNLRLSLAEILVCQGHVTTTILAVWVHSPAIWARACLFCVKVQVEDDLTVVVAFDTVEQGVGVNNIEE